MSKKRYRPEEIISKLREGDVLISQGKKVADVIKALGITDVTYYRWRQKYGGMSVSQGRRLKELEKENERLRNKLWHDKPSVGNNNGLPRLQLRFIVYAALRVRPASIPLMASAVVTTPLARNPKFVIADAYPSPSSGCTAAAVASLTTVTSKPCSRSSRR